MNPTQKFKRQQEKKQQEIYDRHGRMMVELVASMEKDGLEAEMAMALMLDKAIDLTFHLSDDEWEARKAIELMIRIKMKGRNDQN